VDESGHDKPRGFIEVYDHSKRPPGVEVQANESLATGRGIVFGDIRSGDCVQYRVHVSEHLRASPSEVVFDASVEDDASSVLVYGFPRVPWHGRES
jgi:hypothetical protein